MRQYFVIIPLLIIGLFNVFIGCERDIKGPVPVNNKPIVNFVNIPVKDALFSSDTTIYWYGSDVDGFIDYFYYIVISQADVGNDVEAFLAGGGLPPIDTGSAYWTPIKVELENTGTSARIQMSADISDPVRKYVTSYVFLVAVDNDGTQSDVAYRTYAKNNHFPNTSLSVHGFRDPYINALKPGTIIEGVIFGFSGQDRIDYPRNPPPFEYRWKIFGPFSDSVKKIIDSAYISDSFVDLYGDFYRHGDTLRYYSHLDTTGYTIVDDDTLEVLTDTVWNEFLADNMLGGNPYGFWQDAMLGIDSSMDVKVLDSSDYGRLADLTLLDEYVVDSSSDWTYNTQVNVFDVFSKQNINPNADTTRVMSFLVWCQARDDAKVPDPIPEFSFISVIEPKFERDVIIIDATTYERSSAHNWPIFPMDPWLLPDPKRDNLVFPDTSGPAIRNVLGEYINEWKTESFDAENVLFDDTLCPDANPDDCGSWNLHVTRKWRNGTTQDYFAIRAIDPYYDSGYGSISMMDVLRHKIMLVVKDDTSEPIGFETLEGLAIVTGLNSGMNAWIMARAAEGTGFVDAQNPTPDPLMASEVLSTYFGVSELHPTGWQEQRNQIGIRIEDFVGARSLISDLPHLLIDTTRLETFYLWDSTECAYPEKPCYPYRDLNTGEIIRGAMPEVGFVVKGLGTELLYRYKSKYGKTPPPYIGLRQGTVVAIRKSAEFYRTAFFCFNLMAMDEVTGKKVFKKMMNWLSYQPYINAGKVNPNYFGSDIKKYRSISNRLHALKTQGLLPSMSEL